MRRLFVIAVFFTMLWVSAGWAENVQPAVSTTTLSSTTTVVMPAISTAPFAFPVSTPTIADAGETISTPTPHAMTDPSNNNPSFVTLTRTQVPGDRLPANADIVFPERARLFDALNAGEALSHEPGLILQPQGGASYPLTARIQGASPNQTLVLLDGRPMAGAALGAMDLLEIPIEQIDHLEIVRGGQSALYGPNAMGGVINVISKRAVYTGFPISHVSYESSGYGRQNYKLDFGSRQGPVDYVFFGDQQWESGFRRNSDNRQYNMGGNAGVWLGRGGKLMMDAGSFHNNAGVPGIESLQPTPAARRVTDSNYLRGSYRVGLPKDMTLAARFFGSQREVDLNDSADPNPVNAASADRREHSKGGDLQMSLPLGLLVGGSFTHDQEDVLDRLTASNSFSAWTENWGLFAQETLQWGAFTLIPAGRYDQNSQFGHSTNPRIQAIVEATDWLRLSGSEGRSFRAPTMDEWRFNPALLPEKAWTDEAGFELHGSSQSLRANVFRSHVGDAIQSSTFSAVNVGSARRQGVEIKIEHVVNEYFRQSWNYTYLENTGIPSGDDHPVLLAYSPRHTVNGTAVFTPSKKWEISPTLRYEDARFSGNDHTGVPLSSQLVIDLRLAYQWRQMELFFGIKDITDKRYDEISGYPLAGRTAYGGIRLRLWG